MGCKHVATVVYSLATTSALEETLNTLAGGTRGGHDQRRANASPLRDQLLRLCPAQSAGRRKFPVLIQGDYSTGKTTEARAFGDTEAFDHRIEIHGHAGLEAIDILGGLLPVEGERALAWVDGPMARAFRQAEQGGKVFLLVDELYRMPRRERSVFLSALSPARKTNGKYVYRLKTGRPLPAASSGLPPTIEMLEAPEENISIVATTNVGPAFEIEEEDPAEGSRWHRIHYEPAKDKVASILHGESASLGFTKQIVPRLVKFIANMKHLRTDGETRLVPSVRELIRALHISPSEADVQATLLSMVQTWATIDPDGTPNPEQVKAITEALAEAFK